MKKKTNKKGFTIMEMLIVVAIIAVLAAILIPTFNGALTKSKEAADVANIRAGYAELQVKMLTDNADIPKDEAEFIKDYIKNATLNYNDASGDGNKLTYTYDDANKKATITYTPKKVNNDKPYTWTIQSPDIS